MNNCRQDGSSAAWYFGTRKEFLEIPTQQIADQLAGRVAIERLDLDGTQAEEWRQSIIVIQTTKDARISNLRQALEQSDCEVVGDVILEFAFRRRARLGPVLEMQQIDFASIESRSRRPQLQ